MTRNQRIGLVVAALAVAVIAFVVAQPGDDEESPPASKPTSAGETAESTPTEQKPAVTRIRVKGGVVVGEAKTIRVAKNDIVRIVVSSDVPDEIHLHGYDIEKEAAPGEPARFRFKADAEGAFELESHAAEDAGNEPLVARLLVGPS
jgi:heme/copper-type cytochrome/quinol oxidase subunit 2